MLETDSGARISSQERIAGALKLPSLAQAFQAALLRPYPPPLPIPERASG
jgi:hypothetical protein